MLSRLSTYAFPSGGMYCYYHTSSVKNAIDIVLHNHLFGSFPSKVNDPGEMKIETIGLSENRFLNANKNVSDRVNEELSKKEFFDRIYRFVCFAQADKVDNDRDSQLYFWTKYAGCFSGVRFKFLIDSSFLKTPSPNEVFCDLVTYKNHTIKLDLSKVTTVSDICQEIRSSDLLKEICYVKTPRWNLEYELRLGSVFRTLKLSMSRISSREERFFVFDPHRLVGVDIGALADPVDSVIFNDLLKQRGIQVRVVESDLIYRNV